MQRVEIYDPLYGPISFPSEFVEILSCPEIQRLRHVRMCDIHSLNMPGASNISRYEHSIGTAYLARLFARNITTDQHIIDSFTLAALAHDVMTAPFGHSMEYVLTAEETRFDHVDIEYGLFRDNFSALREIPVFAGMGRSLERKIIKNFGQSVLEEMLKHLKGKSRLSTYIDGTIDLDNIDNVYRLAFHLGLPIRKSIPLELANSMRVCSNAEDNIPCFLSQAKNAIKDWGKTRSNLYSLLINFPGEFSAKGMLTRAIELSIRQKIIDLTCWNLTDEGLLDLLLTEGTPQVKNLIQKLMIGELLPPTVLISTSSWKYLDDFMLLENKESLERHLNTAKHAVISSSKLSTGIIKNESRSRYLWENGNIELSGLELVNELKRTSFSIIHTIPDKRKSSRQITVSWQDKNGNKEKLFSDTNKLWICILSGSSRTNQETSPLLKEWVIGEVALYLGADREEFQLEQGRITSDTRDIFTI